MRTLKRLSRWILALFFIVAGLNHFAAPYFYLRMVPPWLPWHGLLVDVSGICEMVLGLLLAVHGCRRFAAWGLVALLMAIFPANIRMALHPDLFPSFRPAMLWVRLPFQFVMIAWILWCTNEPEPPLVRRARFPPGE